MNDKDTLLKMQHLVDKHTIISSVNNFPDDEKIIYLGVLGKYD